MVNDDANGLITVHTLLLYGTVLTQYIEWIDGTSTNPGQTNPGQYKPWTVQTLDKQTLDSTNPGQVQTLDKQPLDK